jgi:phytoene dehydrogenase-like protein
MLLGMGARYDVLVVGAGLGGLAAAARLARAGRSVRILERHRAPGGYATTFVRGRFEFEVSLHALSGIGAPGSRGPLWTGLEELGVNERLRFLPVPSLGRTVAPGLDLRIPASQDGALAALVDAFPRERSGLVRFFERVFAIDREIAEVEAGGPRGWSIQSMTRYPALFHALTVPLSVLLYRELEDPLARLAVGQLWSYFGLPPSRLSLALFAAGLARYLRFGVCYLEGKSRALAAALVAVIEEAGGELSLGEGAARILAQDGRVRGVISDSGEQLEAATVVANASPLTVAHELIGAELLPDAHLRRLSRAEPSASSVCVHLGLSRDRRELGLEDHQVFLSETVDLEEQYAGTRRLEAPGSFLITAYSVTDPGFAPPGTSVVTLVTLSDGRAWQGVSGERYRSLKQRYADEMVRRAARLYPELPASIEVREVSTPRTNQRFTGNPLGAIYGFASTVAESPAFRLEQRAPLEGLWFAGAWTRPGAGFELAIASGLTAASGILEETRVRS